MYSPLEQFAVNPILPFNFPVFGSLYFSLTNSSLSLLLIGAILICFMHFILQSGTFLIPTRWQSIIEMVYEFCTNLVSEQIGNSGKHFFPIVFSLFVFILSCNLVGMAPYSFCVTAHIAITFTLSFMVFFAMTFVGFKEHGLHFFAFFLPPGAPLALAPFLVVIEIVSYSFRGISLGVRLFANMCAGHCLIKILAGFGWIMFKAGGIITIGGFMPVIVVFVLMFLEVAVAFLQAYVFTILTCIYLNDAIHLH